MLTRDGKLLLIFEDFRIDTNLPKYVRPRGKANAQDDGEDMAEPMESFGDSQMSSSRRFSVRTSRGGNVAFITSGISMNGDEEAGVLAEMKPTRLQRVLLYLLRLVSPPDKKLVWRPLNDPPPPAPTISILEFFSSLKGGTTNLEVVKGRAEGYEAAILRAKATGQVAMREQLEAGVEAVRAETRLLDLGLTKILLEETVVEFVKKSPKGLRLDWVKNFTRLIPDEVLATKKRCDEEQIFDNYVVLHYDPEAKSWAETQAETAARKDPILFGVLQGRRQLYFIGEWVDEFCDLSLDQMADVLGRRAEGSIDPEKY